MGAELFIAAAPAPMWQDGTIIRGREAVTTTEAVLLAEQVHTRLATVHTDILAAHFGGDDEDEATLREYAHERVMAVLFGWYDGREYDARTFGDRYWMLTGGPSWGDDPSDGYSTVVFIDTEDLFVEPFVRPA